MNFGDTWKVKWNFFPVSLVCCQEPTFCPLGLTCHSIFISDSSGNGGFPRPFKSQPAFLLVRNDLVSFPFCLWKTNAYCLLFTFMKCYKFVISIQVPGDSMIWMQIRESTALSQVDLKALCSLYLLGSVLLKIERETKACFLQGLCIFE